MADTAAERAAPVAQAQRESVQEAEEHYVTVPTSYGMHDDAPSQDCELWRESLKDTALGSDEVEELTRWVFEVSFGPAEDRAEGDPLPFFALPDGVICSMTKAVRDEYESELVAATSDRSGRRVVAAGG